MVWHKQVFVKHFIIKKTIITVKPEVVIIYEIE